MQKAAEARWFFAAIVAFAMICSASDASAAVISVNFMQYASQTVSGVYGVTNQDSVAAGWLNLNQVNNFNALPLANGTNSTVNLSGGTPLWASGSAAYAGTPLGAGKATYVGGSSPTITLANLNANFPFGCKVIVYFAGYLDNANALVTDGATTNYFRSASSTAEITNALAAGLYPTTQTTDLGSGNNPLAQYAVFGNGALLTNDTVTISLTELAGSGAWIAGFQIVGAAADTAAPRLFTSEGFAASNYAAGVSLINNATLGYGFDGPWTGYGGQVKAVAGSLNYSGYGADGENHVMVTNNAAIRRTLLAGNNGPLGNYCDTNGLVSLSRDGAPLYLAFLVYASTNQSPGGNFSLYIGDYSGTNRFFMVQLATTNPYPLTITIPYDGAPQTLGNNNGAANLVVARFDFAGANGAVRLWLNPSTSGAEPMPDVTLTNLNIAFDRLQLTHGYASGAAEFDEIRFGNNWAATVQSAALATLPGQQTLVGMRGLPPSPIGGTNFPREFFPFVDAFGQYRFLDWTNKVHSLAELQQRAADETADLSSHPGSDQWDQYGGWLNGPQLAATGFFRVQKYQGDWWFVDPDGHLFWSHGVTGVNAPSVPTAVTGRKNYFANLPQPGDPTVEFLAPNGSNVTGVNAPSVPTAVTGRENYFANLPQPDDPTAGFLTPWGSTVSGGYYNGSNPLTMDFYAANAFLKYGPNWYWFTRDLDQTRLRSWGLNTIGSWTVSDTYLLRRTPYARVFYPYVGNINGDSRLPDYFNPAFATALTNVLSGPERNDPWCLGFYINNELVWANQGLFTDEKDVARTALAAVNTSFAKAALRDQLMSKYGTIAALNAQWGTSYASWTDFLNQRATLPSGTSGDTDLTAFYRNYAEQFFRTCGTVIHSYTSNLFLGCRFAGPYPDAARACTNYVDVASVNSYASTFSIPAGLEADIPVLNSEHNICAKDTGLFWGGLNTVSSQAQRASSYTSHFNSAIGNSRIVGTHWFQMLDRSTTGILNSDADGDNNNGLVDVCDTPYYPLIAAVRSAGQAMYSQRLGTAPPTISALTNRTIQVNTSTGPMAFTVGDDTTAAGSLTVSGASSNNNLVPPGNLVFGGSGANRTVTVTPQAGWAGTADITLTVTDASGARGFATFTLTVLPNPPVLNSFAVSGQNFQLTVSGNAGLNYYLQTSTNLTDWQTVFTNLNATPPFVWSDAGTTNYRSRFYRVLLSP
ncbi:MAG TPA: hypothetical protein VFV96_12540 [Verrucomicrobiae bacterium]|nr:hypothetical protein [Verrucomicrobiae bacterium]